MSTVCPMPTGLTPEAAHAKYLQKKKELPGLTPAAWRKAAAQDLGMDYNDFLAIWKQAQGKSKATKLVADPIPTKPAAMNPGPTMKIPMKPKPSIHTTMANWDKAVKELEDVLLKGELDIDDVDDILADMKNDYAGLFNVSDLDWNVKAAKAKFDKAFDKYEDDLVKKNMKVADESDDVDFGDLIEDDLPLATESAETATEMSSKFTDDVMDHVMTNLGPLNHDLAQTVYKKMKKEMPGGTPAQWRHAASDYLGVDYNEYLAAWKKPGTVSKKSKKIIDGTPNPTTPTSSHPAGKYGGKYVTHDTVLDEVAKAYGPSAQKQYINIISNELDDHYSVQFPNSLFPTEAAKDAVADKLRALGFKVDKGHAGHYNIKMYKAAKKKEAKKPFAAGENTKTITLSDGRVVWDSSEARDWSNAWYKSLTSTQQKAVKSYTGSGYRTINSSLRGGKAGSPTANALSDALEEIQHSFTVFRGTHISMDEFVKGEQWSDQGFMSTAITPGSAWSGVKFEIRLSPGVRGAYVDPVSSHRGEMEFIIDKGTQFRVLEVDEAGKKVVLVAIP